MNDDQMLIMWNTHKSYMPVRTQIQETSISTVYYLSVFCNINFTTVTWSLMVMYSWKRTSLSLTKHENVLVVMRGLMWSSFCWCSTFHVPYDAHARIYMEIQRAPRFYSIPETVKLQLMHYKWVYKQERQWRSAHPASRNIKYRKFHVVQFSTGQKINIWCPGKGLKTRTSMT